MKVGDSYSPHKMFTGIYIPDSLVKLDTISPGAKLCFGRLCWHAGSKDEAFPSLKSLGEEIGCSERSAQAYTQELEDLGFIKRVRHGQQGNTYEFIWHEVLENSLRKVKANPQDSAVKQKPPIFVNPQFSVAQPAEFRKKTECINNVLREGLREELREKEEEERTPLDIFSHRWKGFFSKFQKLNKPLLEIVRQKYPNGVALAESQLAAALHGYRESEWAKQQRYPVLGFLKNPATWLSDDPGESRELSPISTDPPPAANAPAPPNGQISPNQSCSTLSALQEPPIVEQWNQITGQNVSRSQFDQDEWRKIEKKVAEIPRDKLAESFKKAAHIIANTHASHKDNGYIEFDWVILKGWAALLRSNRHNWLMRADGKEPPKSVTQQLREDRQKEREEKLKNAHASRPTT